MDSKTIVKSFDHVVVADEERLSKMPTATSEQLNLAKILSKKENDAELKRSVALLQELAKCTEDEAATALYDCENDIQKAVDSLLDRLRHGQSDWHTTGKKSRVKHTSVNESNGPVPVRGKGDIRVSDKQKGVAVVNSRVSHGKSDGSCDSPKESSDESSVVKNNRTVKHPRKIQSNSSETLESQTDVKPPTRPVGLKDQRSTMKLNDGWDPYTEYGEWGGEAIEVVNSNVSLAHGLQSELPPADELFLDTNKPAQEAASTLTTESSLEALSPKSTVQSDEDTLFISKACSKPPGLAFTKLPDVPVFIVPDILPKTHSGLSFKFGDHGLLNGTSSTMSAVITGSSNLSTATPQPDLDSRIYPPMPAHRSPRNFESTDGLSTNTIVHDKKSESSQSNAPLSSSQYRNMNVAPKSASQFSGDPAGQVAPAAFSADRLAATQQGFLESSLKNYLLDNLPNDLGKLSVTNPSIRTEANPPQFSIPPSSQPHVGQSSTTGPSMPQQQPQMNKPSLPHLTTHTPFHASQQQSLVSNASQQSQTSAAAATLPPGMTHFISQFAPAPYHMFNSGNTPAILEQLYHQNRIFYDMQMHQQSATTATQSLLTSSSEASTTSKPHPVPSGPMSHVTAAGAPIRPDMLAPAAIGAGAQMLPGGHPFFSYPGFVFMNSYPNAFMNQPQSGADSASGAPLPHANPNMTQTASQSSSSQSFSGMMKPMNAAAYEEFLDMKYGDPSKQVGYKSQSQAPFSNFQSHIDGSAAAAAKMSTSHTSANGGLNPGFGMNSSAPSASNTQPFLPQYYQPGVSLNAAVALAQQQHQSQHQGPPAATAVNQQGAGAAGHQLGSNHAQPLVMGSSGPPSMHHAAAAAAPHHHHPAQQRPVMSHPH